MNRALRKLSGGHYTTSYIRKETNTEVIPNSCPNLFHFLRVWAFVPFVSFICREMFIEIQRTEVLFLLCVSSIVCISFVNKFELKTVQSRYIFTSSSCEWMEYACSFIQRLHNVFFFSCAWICLSWKLEIKQIVCQPQKKIIYEELWGCEQRSDGDIWEYSNSTASSSFRT